MNWLRLAPYLIGAVLAVGLLGGVGWHFYGAGYDAAQAEHAEAVRKLEADLADVSAANRAAAAIIEANRAAQATLSQELENEARQDPDAVRRVPSPDSLRRLERRWGGAR